MNLSARNISFAIKDLTILRDIDLEIQGGKTTVLLGPNGAGKSTLLQLIRQKNIEKEIKIQHGGLILQILQYNIQ